VFDGFFILNLVIAFFVGGVWIAITTVAADRFGSKVGGFIGGLPSTAVISFFFIGLVQTPQLAAKAARIFPLSYGFSGLFLVVYAFLAKKGLIFGITGSLIAWFTLSGLTVLFNVENYLLILLAYILTLLFSFFLLEYRLKIPSIEKRKISYSKLQIVLRALFGGSMISFAVFMSRIGGPTIGGIFSGFPAMCFPAMFISTLIISYRSQGLDFSRSMTKPLMITGMITIVMYGIAVSFTYPHYGLLVGTTVSFFISMISAYLTFRFILKKLK
jgi:hypothetical protein